MGLYSRTTRTWLEHRFQRRSPTGVYHAHMPIYGVGQGDAEGGHLGRLARIARILRVLDGLPFTSLLDVGGAEGYVSHLVRTLFGARVVTADLSLQACLRARELFGLPAAAVDCARLPFADGAFDVVLCSEVLEHVEHPVEAMLELGRVAKVAVVMTTEELHYDRAAIDDYLFRRPGWPHMERNQFHPDDLAWCFPGASMMPQTDAPPPQDQQADVLDRAAAAAWILANTQHTELAPGRLGVVLTAPRPGMVTTARRHSDAALIERMLSTTVAPGSRWPRAARPDADLFNHLRDPLHGDPLRVDGDSLVSANGHRYPLHDGVPDFVDASSPEPTRADCERRLNGDAARRAALLALRDRMHLPDRWPQDYFDLRQPEQRRGFWPNQQLVPRAGGAGFCWHATGNDPWVVMPCLQRPVHEIEIELRIHNPTVPLDAGTGQVFWKGVADDDFAEARSVTFPLQNDGRVHRYLVVLRGHPLLPQEVQFLRLDLVDGPCEVDLLSLRLG